MLLIFFYLFVCCPSNEHDCEQKLDAKNLDRTTFQDGENP